MRPGISPGNAGSRAAISGRCTTGGGGFNEAGGFLPRKRADAEGHRVLGCPSFNEAGGFLPRKLAVAEVVGVAPGHALASMRPGDFSPGNPRHGRVRSTAYRKCFNEAGGFLPRKRRIVAHLREAGKVLQ